ncbi:ABC transporter ATP-binding protein [Microbispora sp. H10885]|uniref:ABC transporter ATP-binding protein n=1 Tax=Microbispora sp. H10885 TaxID=2729110 RepID=UPI0015FF9AA2|nr:ABC transporter ATP-binding protein [Microbispora sp. H10885]
MHVRAVTEAGQGSGTTLSPPIPDRGHAPGPWRLLADLLRPRRRPLALAMTWSLVEAAPALLSGLLVAAAVDQGFLAGRPGAGMAWLGLMGATMLVKAVATRLMFPHLAAVVEPVRDDLVRAVVKATVVRAADGGETPDAAAVNRLTRQIETLRSLLSAMLRNSRELGISVIAALVGLLVLSPVAAALVAGPLVAALAVFARLLRVLVARQRELVLSEETLTAQTAHIVAGLRDIAACGAQDPAKAALRTLVDAQARASRALAWAGTSRRLVVMLGAHVPLIGLLLAAPLLIRHGHLTAGEVVGAATYLFTGLEPALRAILDSVGSWGVTLTVTARRIAGAITLPALPAPSQDAARDGVPTGHELRAEHLTFSYSPQATPVVRDLDLTIGEGEHLAVVGPSGVGKSTLAMLMTGLRRPTGGRMRLGGAPLVSVPEARLRSSVALVPQEAYVFAGTVRENLAYLCPETTGDEWLRTAVDAVGAGALVERLGGIDGTIEEPSALSAGERQLIALARVHASPAGVVILDEATCHLDPAAELRAETALAARPGTLIVIAHRISSAIRARRVLLMDGTSALTGTHAELIDRSPLYADLVGHWNNDGMRDGVVSAVSSRDRREWRRAGKGSGRRVP